MDSLGKYAGAVIGSYLVSIGFIVVLVTLSLWKAARVKRALAEIEARQGKDNG
jgi:heme exporter protein D